MTNKILIFEIKKIILDWMFHNWSVILSNLPRKIIISSLPFKFFLEVKIYKRKISIISINGPN
jgi:hypothetical protein